MTLKRQIAILFVIEKFTKTFMFNFHCLFDKILHKFVVEFNRKVFASSLLGTVDLMLFQLFYV